MPIIMDDAGKQIWTPYDEEKRRKEKAAAEAAAKARYRAMRESTALAPTSKVSGRGASRVAPQVQRLEQQERRQYVSRARTISQIPKEEIDNSYRKGMEFQAKAQQAGYNTDPLHDWQRVKRILGPEELDDRTQAAYEIWRKYLRPYNGSSLVLEMVKSPLSVEELEAAAQQGALALNNRLKGQSANYLPESMAGASKGEQMAAATFGGYVSTPGGDYDKYVLSPDPLTNQFSQDRAFTFFWFDQKAKEATNYIDTYDQWQTDTANQKPELVQNLEEMTGIKRADFQSWRQWEDAIRSEVGIQRGQVTVAAKDQDILDALDEWADYQTKDIGEKHGDEILGRFLSVVNDVSLFVPVPGGAAMKAAKAGIKAGEAVWGGTKIASIAYKGVKTARTGAMFYKVYQVAGPVMGEYMPAARAAEEAETEFEQWKIDKEKEAKKEMGIGPGDTMSLRTSKPGEVVGSPSYLADRVYEANNNQEYMTEAAKLYEKGLIYEANVFSMMAANDLQGVKDFQLEMQSGQHNETEYGRGLVANGVMTMDWWVELRKMFRDEERFTAEQQMALRAGGFATEDMEITGSMYVWDDETQTWEQDKKWKKAYDTAMEEWEKQAQYAEDHPFLYTFLEASQIPLTSGGWHALWNNMTSEGGLYIPLKVLTQAAVMPGALYNGSMATVNMWASMKNDPERQALEEQIIQAVEKSGIRREQFAQESTPDVSLRATSVNTEGQHDMGIGEAMDIIESGDLAAVASEEDLKWLQDMATSYEGNTAKHIASSGQVDYISTVRNIFGDDYEDVQKWAADHPDMTHAINIGLDIALNVALIKGKGQIYRPVRRNYQAFMNSFRADRALSRFVKEFNRGNMGAARRALGGGDSATVMKELGPMRYKDVEVGNPEIARAADTVKDIARNADMTELQKVNAILNEFPLLKGNREKGMIFARKLVRRVGLVDELQVQKTQVMTEARAVSREARELEVRRKFREGTEPQIDRMTARHARELDNIISDFDKKLEVKTGKIDTTYNNTMKTIETQRKKKLADLDWQREAKFKAYEEQAAVRKAEVLIEYRQRKIKAAQRNRKVQEINSGLDELKRTYDESVYQPARRKANEPYDVRVEKAETTRRERTEAAQKEIREGRTKARSDHLVTRSRELGNLQKKMATQENRLTAKAMEDWDAKQPPLDTKLLDVDSALQQMLRNRQRGRGEILGIRDFSKADIKHRLAQYWGGKEVQATDRAGRLLWEDAEQTVPQMTTRYYDILPHLQLPGVKRPSRTAQALRSYVANQSNRLPAPARSVFNALMAPFIRAPMLKASVDDAEFADRVGDFVASYSGSLTHADAWRTRAVMTDFTKPSAVRAFEAALSADAERYVVRGQMHSSVVQRAERALGEVAGGGENMVLAGDVGRTQIGTKFTRETNAAIDKELARARKDFEMAGTVKEREAAAAAYNEIIAQSGRVGEYMSATGETRQVTMATSQQKRTVNLGRDVMWAPLKVLDGTDAFGHALNWTRTNSTVVAARNLGRGFTAFAQTMTTPLRLLAVSVGFVTLFQKHSLADTMRSLADEGLSVGRYRAHKKTFMKSLDNIDPAIRQQILLDLHVAEEGEYHYIAEGGMRYTWKQSKVFDSAGRARNMEKGIDTVRRIVDDKGFIIYASEGMEGLTKWLGSKAGKDWVRESGAYKKTTDILDISETKLKESEVMDLAIKTYAEDMVTLFKDYGTMEYLYGEMVKMAKGELTPHRGSIEQALLAAHKRGENPMIQMEVESGANPVYNIMTKAIKTGMTPNRVNRALVFYDIYHKVYKELRKDKNGLDNTNASRIAAGVARLRTNQVHFDLSNAFKFEAKNRWYAWFGTKHRLWSTWLARTALRNPLYSAAIGEYLSWMEDRNSDESIPEWEKHNIKFMLGGKEVNFNLAPQLWMTEYAQESMVGFMIQDQTIGNLNALLGTNIPQAKSKFDPSFTRLDGLLRSVNRWVKMHEVDTNADVQDRVDKMDPDMREKFLRNMAVIWVDSGRKKSLVECYRQVETDMMRHEALKLVKSSSIFVRGPEDLKRQQLQKDYAKITDPDLKAQFLMNNPDYAATIGVQNYEDPLLWRTQIVPYLEKKRQLQFEMEKGFDAIWRAGDMDDQQAVNNLWSQYDDAVDQLEAEYPEGVNYDASFGTEDMNKIIKFYLPLTTDPVAWADKFSPPSDTEVEQYRDTLQDDLEKTLVAAGLDPTSNGMGVRRMKKIYVEEEVERFKLNGANPYTWGEQNNARWLERSATGNEGKFRSTIYLEMIASKNKRDLMMRGLKNGKADKTNLLMAFLTPTQKEYVGMNVSQQAEAAWDELCMAKERADYLVDHIVIPDTDTKTRLERTTSEAKAIYADVDRLIDRLLQENRAFAFEWQFSNYDAKTRMRKLGFENPETSVGQGWIKFLDLQDQADAIAAKEINKNTKEPGVSIRTMQKRESRALEPIQKQMAQLMTDYPEWYDEYQQMGLSMTKFGWWFQLPDGSDMGLWNMNETMDEEEYNQLYGEWGGE